MEHRRLGKSELNVSVIGLGTWAIGGFFWGHTDEAAAVAAIQKAIDKGINLIDTAPIYGDGHSEELVSKAIKGRRHQVIIATKCGVHQKEAVLINNLTPKSIREEVEGLAKAPGHGCHRPLPVPLARPQHPYRGDHGRDDENEDRGQNQGYRRLQLRCRPAQKGAEGRPDSL